MIYHFSASKGLPFWLSIADKNALDFCVDWLFSENEIRVFTGGTES